MIAISHFLKCLKREAHPSLAALSAKYAFDVKKEKYMSIAERVKVLIVDDQFTSRVLLGDALQQLGFQQITVAVDGEQGARIMAQQPHHLVISDFNMPKMDGLGLLAAVRNNPRTKKAAFLMLTSQGDRALVMKAAALGANNVLAKPFTIERMKAAIEAVFGPINL